MPVSSACSLYASTIRWTSLCRTTSWCPKRIAELKREHLGVHEATDVLSFPIDGRDELPAGVPRQLGDVVVCPDVVGEEWRRPLVHALLHLVGYDHGPEMEAREAVYSG